MVLYAGWPLLHYLTYLIAWIGRIVRLGREERLRRPRHSRGRSKNLTRICSISESGIVLFSLELEDKEDGLLAPDATPPEDNICLRIPEYQAYDMKMPFASMTFEF
jgi:hypothetical protein